MVSIRHLIGICECCVAGSSLLPLGRLGLSPFAERMCFLPSPTLIMSLWRSQRCRLGGSLAEVNIQ